MASEAPAMRADLLEVYGLIRTNLVGVEKGEIDRRAVEALVSAFAPRVRFAGAGEPTNAGIARSELYAEHYPYFRIAGLADGVHKEFRRVYNNYASSNKVQGVILDLRFGNGEHYEAAAALADEFVGQEQKLFTTGKTQAKSKAKNNAITVPVAVLVNRETAGATEVLAAVLRSLAKGLILGSETAGRAATSTTFQLKSGQSLEVATEPVLLADGTELRSLEPDIKVEVSPADERAYLADPYAILHPPVTNLASVGGMTTVTNRVPRRTRYGEADLARERREGVPFDPETPRRGEPEKAAIQDPALARALDLLMGLAVVRGR